MFQKKRTEEKNEYMRKKLEKDKQEEEEIKAVLESLPIGEHDHPLKAYMLTKQPNYKCPYSHTN